MSLVDEFPVVMQEEFQKKVQGRLFGKRKVPVVLSIRSHYLIIKSKKSRQVVNLTSANVYKQKVTCFVLTYSPNPSSICQVAFNHKTAETVDDWVSKIEQVCKTSHTPLSIDDFQELRVLGKGHFGQVSLVRHRPTNVVLALKVMKEEAGNSTISAFKLKKQITERAILAKLDHQFITKLGFAFRFSGNLYLASEYAQSGDLWQMIKKRKRVTVEECRFITSELVAALGYCHKLGIIHRDIKLENVMLDRQGHVKLIDFGLAKELKGDLFTKSIVGTEYYKAPEMLQGNRAHNAMVDWWQVGCLVFEVLTGRPCFYSKFSVEKRILSGRGADSSILKKFVGESIESGVDSLVNGLLEFEMKHRLGYKSDATEVQEHSFFASVDFSNIELQKIPEALVSYLSGERDDAVDSGDDCCSSGCSTDASESCPSSSSSLSIIGETKNVRKTVEENDSGPFIGFHYAIERSKLLSL